MMDWLAVSRSKLKVKYTIWWYTNEISNFYSYNSFTSHYKPCMVIIVVLIVSWNNYQDIWVKSKLPANKHDSVSTSVSSA